MQYVTKNIVKTAAKNILRLFPVMLCSVQAVAETPDIADALRQLPPMKNIAPQQDLPLIKAPSPEINSNSSQIGQTLAVSRIILDGNTVLPAKEIAAFLDQFTGKNLTLANLQSLAQQLTERYKQQGYITSRVVLPAQDIKDGVVRLKALEGGYGTFTLNNTSLVSTETLTAIASPLQDNPIVALQDIERTLRVMGNRAGVNVANIEVARGATPKTSDFTVTTTAKPRLSGYVLADNYGSDFTGENRVSGRLDIASPTGIGDKISLSALTTDGEYLENYQAVYSLPLTSSGLTAEFALSRTTYQLTSTFSSLDAQGVADSFEATLSYPLIQERALSLDAAITGVRRNLADEIQSTNTKIPKAIDAITAEVTAMRNTTFLSCPNILDASVSMTFGNLDIKDAVAANQDSQGAQTEGEFAKINAEVTHTTALSPRWDVLLSVRAQQALHNKNLDGSEDFSISGINAAKAYPSGEFAAENAVFQSIEARYRLPDLGRVTITLAPFFEIGRAMTENKIGSNTAQTLSDTGLNIYTTHGNLFATTTLAQRLSSAATSEKTPERVLLVSGGVRF
jgi:hemolysin activation/secretion protein